MSQSESGKNKKFFDLAPKPTAEAINRRERERELLFQQMMRQVTRLPRLVPPNFYSPTQAVEPPVESPFKGTAQRFLETPPRAAVQPTPDYTQCLTGYRRWLIPKRDRRLRSLNEQFGDWPIRSALKATCYRSDSWEPFLGSNPKHDSPYQNCHCGIYAFKEASSLDFEPLGVDLWDVEIGWGIVDLWGRVIEHEHGWRAEFAYPRELWLFNGAGEDVAALYGVPVRVIERSL
jgi:hypothetical protein